MKETIKLESAGFDVEYHVDATAKFLRENRYPQMDAQKVEFRIADGLSAGWLLSEIKSETQTRVFEAYGKRHGLYTNLGIMYVSYSWNEAMFVVDKHYYYLSK